jgi:dCTP deaminase
MRTIWTEFQAHDFIYLDPYEFILGQTMEKVEIPYHLVARIEGRSSIGRQGISIHQTAGYIDAGFKGKITLEIFNATRFRQKIPVGMRFCQLVVETLTKPAQRPYGHRSLNSKYQYQVKPEPSRIVEDFDDFEKTKIINTIDNINDSNYL